MLTMQWTAGIYEPLESTQMYIEVANQDYQFCGRYAIQVGADCSPCFRINVVTTRWQITVEYVHCVTTSSNLHMHIEVCNRGLQDGQRLRHQCCDSSTLPSLTHAVQCYVASGYG